MAKCENCYHAEICKNYPNTGLPPKMRQELIHKGCEYYINNSDVQEVVRCKDCEYRKTEDCAMQYDCECGAQYFWESDNAFCSWGKRKENGIDDE